MACPDHERLAAFGRGELDPGLRAELHAHLQRCEDCRTVVSGLAGIHATLGQSGRSVDPDDICDELTLADDDKRSQTERKGSHLQPGARLDRYHILEQVGAGGMGIVYAAYDADLDRKVALKVLHERASGDDLAQRRLLREAQAMARLSHPNVITVHEVRMVKQRVFISMEFVEGGTLGDWLKREQPEQERVLATFRDIGRGLAAAHAAGLVHRDVKPDNVLIGADERPRVTDFGLARPSDDLDASGASRAPMHSPRPTDPGLGELAAQRPLDITLTRTGAMVGTPAYMAPEQFHREPTTPASDQFSFCVALYEALYGQRPFVGRTLPQLVANVLSKTFAEPEDQSSEAVPRWLRQVVRRGLSFDPELRWPSMDALVEQLEPKPRRTRRRLAIASVVGMGLITATTLAKQGLSATSDPCEPRERAMKELWDDDARREVHRALSSGSTAHATETARIAARRIDDYVEQWSASHEDACESYQQGWQSDEAYDLRGACLDERRHELDALVSVLAEADPDVREHAVDAIVGLPPIGPCDDVETLRVRTPLPDDPKVRARVQQLEQALTRSRALLHAGRYPAALTIAEDTTQAARPLDYGPLLARSLQVEAKIRNDLDDREKATVQLRESWHIALGAGDDPLAARAAVELANLLGFGLQKFDDAQVCIDDARAMIGRVRRYDTARAAQLDGDLLLARGRIELRKQHPDEALALFQLALQQAQPRFETNALPMGPVHNSLAGALMALQDWEEALQHYQRVLDIYDEHLGPTHPRTATLLNNLGLALKHLGRYEESIEHFERGKARLEAALGPQHYFIGSININLAGVYFSTRRYEDAVALYDPYADMFDGENLTHLYVLNRANAYAISLARTSRFEDARSRLGMVLENAQQLDNLSIVRSVVAEYAHLALATGDPHEALEWVERFNSVKGDKAQVRQAEVALTEALARLARDEPDDREQAAALRPMIEATRDSHGTPSSADVARLVLALGDE